MWSTARRRTPLVCVLGRLQCTRSWNAGSEWISWKRMCSSGWNNSAEEKASIEVPSKTGSRGTGLVFFFASWRFCVSAGTFSQTDTSDLATPPSLNDAIPF
eukprot:Gregarina_sp_Poly_1__7127@NODE_38_length_18185_cov_164_455735_g33_i0_p18_GENE_NODE_38_length_18185_cov_164_455735_g33_i0NODE_38_length_18185_cov_164_455735_g33_i0_p18_ORF_typecomplete_len101_score11_38_NODE_38_length_18185_cov_164_455735_g33_i041284430